MSPHHGTRYYQPFFSDEWQQVLKPALILKRRHLYFIDGRYFRQKKERKMLNFMSSTGFSKERDKSIFSAMVKMDGWFLSTQWMRYTFVLEVKFF